MKKVFLLLLVSIVIVGCIKRDEQGSKIKNRLVVYDQQTKPLIAYYEKKGLLKHINAMEPIGKVFGKITELI